MRIRVAFLKTVLLLTLTICLIGSAFADSLRNQLASESTVEQVIKRGVLRVGMSTFVPWAMNDKSGNLVGFEIDVAKRLAQDMGVKAEFVPTKWAGIIPALLTGKFDIIIGGMGIRPDRNLKVNFSNPYDFTGQSMVANQKLAPGLSRLEDFNREDFVISVRLGSTSVGAVKKYLPKAKMVMFDDESQAYQEVINGKAHAMVGSAPTPAFQALKYPDVLYLPFKETFAKEPIGFAVTKGDYDTINYLNSWIAVVEAEGFLQERKRYWFETTDWESSLK
ncbi:MAG: transporter substrate-binding domain-containing protein [Desulforhabdus sp.]|jgi:polar amino acid transport system substrate-binding protein|nr:transporter substrate-binding domain-containing protein [Desulforhabdus sp.]